MAEVRCAAYGLQKPDRRCKTFNNGICSSNKGTGECHVGGYGAVEQSMTQHRRGIPPRQNSTTTSDGYPLTHNPGIKSVAQKPPNRFCAVCDAENFGYSSKCIHCGVMLQNKKHTYSAPTNEKRLRKKKTTTCNGNKNSYESRSHANKTAKHLLKTRGTQLRAYKCRDCRKWHLTKYRS